MAENHRHRYAPIVIAIVLIVTAGWTLRQCTDHVPGSKARESTPKDETKGN